MRLTLKQIEKEAILQRMKDLDYDKPRVAQSLGISLGLLYNRLNVYEAQAEIDALRKQYQNQD